MADLGAEVILVERPGTGDPARQFPAFHEALNRNKRAVAVDLKIESGREALRALLRTADIMLEGFRPGTMARLGFGWADVSALNPRLIMVSISGFGQDGPYRDRPAHDLSYQAMAGLLYAQARSGVPLPAGDLAIGDLSSAMFATVGALAALHERSRTGRGRHVDVSMTDGLVSWMSVMLGPTMNGEAPADISAEPAYGAFRCGDDRLLTLSIAHEDWFWRPLCEALGMPEHARLKGPERVERRDELHEAIAARLASAPRSHWATAFDAGGIPWGPVNRLEQVLDDPHFRARGLFQSVECADGRSERHVVQPLKFRDVVTRILRPSPALGEHTDEVLRSLGLR